MRTKIIIDLDHDRIEDLDILQSEIVEVVTTTPGVFAQDIRLVQTPTPVSSE